MRKRNMVIEGALVVAAGLWLINSTVGAAHAQDAKQLYDKSCSVCHGPTGKGDGAAGKMLKPPPADFATALKGKADGDIAKVIKEGGKAVGKSAAMPAFSSKMNDAQIGEMVQLVKGLSSK